MSMDILAGIGLGILIGMIMPMGLMSLHEKLKTAKDAYIRKKAYQLLEKMKEEDEDDLVPPRDAGLRLK